jgi:hypothetical protein
MSIYAPVDFNIENLLIGAPEAESIEKGKQKINYFRMKLWDRKVDERIHIQPHKMFCFGVQESHSMEDETKITGYECSFPLIAKVNEHVQIRQDEDENDIPPTWEELGANHEEIIFLNLLVAIHKKCAKNMFENKKKIGLGHVKKLEDMEQTLSPPWHWQKDKETKTINYTKSPTLKAKLIVGMKNGVKMYTRFYNSEDDKLNVMEYVGERFNAIPALAFESIYIGDKYFTFQIKLPEAVIFPAESSNTKRLLRHVTSNITTLALTDDSEKKPGQSFSSTSDPKSAQSEKFVTNKPTIKKGPIRPTHLKKTDDQKKNSNDEVNKLLGTNTTEIEEDD